MAWIDDNVELLLRVTYFCEPFPLGLVYFVKIKLLTYFLQNILNKSQKKHFFFFLLSSLILNCTQTAKSHTTVVIIKKHPVQTLLTLRNLDLLLF